MRRRALGRPTWRRLVILAGATAVAGAALLGPAPAALAHATLLSTKPADGTVVTRPPTTVSVTFNQPVATIAGSLRVYTPGGQRADSGPVTHAGPATVVVGLRPGLGHGTYTVAWRVVSADSHEVEGAFTFSIGAPSATHVGIGSLQSSNGLVNTVFAFVRGLAYGFFVVLAGAVAFLIFCWPEGARRKGVVRLVAVGWAGLLLTALLTILVQGPYAAAEGLGRLLAPGLVRTTLGSRIGIAVQARELLGMVAAIAASVVLPRLPSAGARARAATGAGWLALTMGIAATWAGYDHSSVGGQVPLALATDILHLTATAVWGGGLVMLAAFVLRRPATPAAVASVPRFSSIALGCVVVIVVTGTYMAWREVGSLGPLTGTTYGWLVVAKAAGLCALIGLGYLARRYIGTGSLRRGMAVSLAPVRALAVQARPANAAAGRLAEATVLAVATAPGVTASAQAGARPGPPGPSGPGEGPAIPLGKLRRSVLVEVVLFTAILAVSAVLVNLPTGREAFSQPANATVLVQPGGLAGTDQLHAVVAPAVLGPNAIDLSLTTPDGKPYTPAQVEASLYFPAQGIGPLTVNLTRIGPGRYHATRTVAFTAIGHWQLLVTVRSDAFDETTVVIPVTIY
jgi:copper transport protein